MRVLRISGRQDGTIDFGKQLQDVELSMLHEDVEFVDSDHLLAVMLLLLVKARLTLTDSSLSGPFEKFRWAFSRTIKVRN
jgi:hypothetical protein